MWISVQLSSPSCWCYFFLWATTNQALRCRWIKIIEKNMQVRVSQVKFQYPIILVRLYIVVICTTTHTMCRSTRNASWWGVYSNISTVTLNRISRKCLVYTVHIGFSYRSCGYDSWNLIGTLFKFDRIYWAYDGQLVFTMFRQ